MPTLPWELHDHILQYLTLSVADISKPKLSENAFARRKALSAYSKASHPCCMLARGRLFSSMVLRIYIGDQTTATLRSAISSLRRFAAVLGDSLLFPGLGMVYHIQSFMVQILNQNYGPLEKLLQEGTMACILDMLHGPNHGVMFFGWEQLRGRFDFRKLSDDSFIRAFHNMCRSRDLQHIFIRGLYMLPVTVLNDSNVKNLELYGVQVNGVSDTTICDFRSSVESMGLGRADILELFQRPHTIPSSCDLPFQHLKDIHLVLVYMRSFPKGIFNAANTLQTLKIKFAFTNFSSTTPTYPFRLLNRLETLHMYQDVVLDIQDPWIINPLCGVLDLCSFPRSLKTLSLLTASRQPIDLLDLAKYVPAHEETTPNKREWNRLDALLTQPELSAIAQVNITLKHTVQLRSTSIAGIESFDFEALSMRNRDRLLSVLPGLSRSRGNNPQPFLKVDLNLLYNEHVAYSYFPEHWNPVIGFVSGGKRVLKVPISLT